MKDIFFSGDNVSRLIELTQRDLHRRNIKLDDSYVHTILVQNMTSNFSRLNTIKMNPAKKDFYLKQLCEKSIKKTLQDVLIYAERTSNKNAWTEAAETHQVESEFDEGDFTLDDQFSSNESVRDERELQYDEFRRKVQKDAKRERFGVFRTRATHGLQTRIAAIRKS